ECVAIKVIKKDQVKTEWIMEQIKREISVMRLVRHPNIVELKEVMATKTKIYFVMDYVRCGELFAKIENGRLKEDVAQNCGVYHRDLKLENLLVDENGDLKILDCGLSALHEHLHNDGLLHTQCGTLAYIVPEVMMNKGYDGAKADICSCGVILYVLLGGFLPFQDDNLINMYRKIIKSDYKFSSWFSTESRRLVSKLLVSDPERRIKIPTIMRVPWFRKGLKRPNAFSMQESIFEKFDEEEKFMHETIKKSPSSLALLNAFQIISSASMGFDLSTMFEDTKARSMSTSRCSSKVMIAKIEMVAKRFNFKVARRDSELRLLGSNEGRKGPLLVMAEVFKVAPEVTMVEFSKFFGDTLEYICEEDIRPALKDIVWTWQGDNIFNCNVTTSGGEECTKEL
ncbi:CBL-interacting serine threonine- kinase 25-like, partial [Olea europaea subsp. europaea]